MSEPIAYFVLFTVGGVAGTLNVLAGGGSFLTLPLLIFLGLPPTIANGTNRVAILLQNTGAVWSFRRRGILEGEWVGRAALPALLGVGLGTWAAVRVGEASLQRILATLMVLFAIAVMLDPLRVRLRRGAIGDRREMEPATRPVAPGPWFSVAFFGAGLYGGFVQAGVGFFILAITTLASLDLVRGNALKVLVILLYTPLALGMFAWAGKVDWGFGLVLGSGNLLGGLLGTHLTVLKGHAWVKRVVVVMILVFALKLWMAP